MFGVARGKKPIFFLVAGPAILRGNFVAIGYMQRHMSLMAATAVSHGHIGQMTGVTGETGGFIAVPGVAGGAIKCRMHTGVFFQLFNLRLMTGKTRFCGMFRQGNPQWSMGIGVTA